MAKLFDPLTIKSITLRNRIGLSPMCMYSYTDGLANDWMVTHLATRAAGGAGLIITEATAVEARGRISPHDVGIWSDQHIAPLSRVTHGIKANGAIPAIQLAHAGRKASVARPIDGGKPIQSQQPGAYPIIGPSPIPFAETYQTPREMSLEDIHTVQEAFVQGTKRALAAGFEWIEIHAAHGYLFHSFYSPLSNQRTDQYGGSFENRIRFLVETIRLVRNVWPKELPLTTRISGTDWSPGGWTIQDSVALCHVLKSEGVDLIDCSSGGNVARAEIPVGPGYQVPISEAVRQEVGIPTATVGLITAPSHADEIIRNDRADMVLLGRELLRNPYWPLHAAQALNQPAPIPPQYLRGF